MPSWSRSANSGTRSPGGRIAPAQPSLSSSPCALWRLASSTPTTAAKAHAARTISASWRRAGIASNLDLDVRAHHDRALVWQEEVLDRVGGVARDGEEELLAPA